MRTPVLSKDDYTSAKLAKLRRIAQELINSLEGEEIRYCCSCCNVENGDIIDLEQECNNICIGQIDLYAMDEELLNEMIIDLQDEGAKLPDPEQKTYYLVVDGDVYDADHDVHGGLQLNVVMLREYGCNIDTHDNYVFAYATYAVEALELAQAYDRGELQEDNIYCARCGKSHTALEMMCN